MSTFLVVAGGLHSAAATAGAITGGSSNDINLKLVAARSAASALRGNPSQCCKMLQTNRCCEVLVGDRGA